jgi:hypothetical protein
MPELWRIEERRALEISEIEISLPTSSAGNVNSSTKHFFHSENG